MAETTSWLTPEQLVAWKGLSLMQLQLQAHLARGLARHHLSYQDYLVLATLSDQPDGRRRVVELSEELGWEKSRLSHHISRMCQRGLLTKAPCASDQRGTFVILSDAGRRTLAAAAPGHVRDVQHHFIELLSDAEVMTLTNVAHVVLERLRTSSSLSSAIPDSEGAPARLSRHENVN